MNKPPTGLLLVTALTATALLATTLPTFMVGTASAATPDATVQFGMDANSIAAQKSAGVAPDYGTFWIGPWTLNSGWAGPDAQMASMKSAGVTPAIHFYYWGDDISPSCVENGCWSDLHNAHKNRAGWATLGNQLTQHLNAKMGGAPAVIFLESEFNKGGISTYEPFDGYMAEMAAKIHAGYPNAIVVLGFGAWDSGNWYRFDRVAAESDMVGVQAMRGSTRDSATHYNGIYEGTLSSVQKLDQLFNKPVMLTDLALSSYPEPSYLTMQADNLREIFDNLGTLKANGLEAIIYRSWRNANMDTANYYGEAERHWGLAYPDGRLKAAAHVWIDGVKDERAGSTPQPTTTTTSTSSTTTTTAPGGMTATVSPSGNEWWVQAKVTSAKTVTKVEAKAGSNPFVALNKESYGWSKSLNVPKGMSVQFRVTASDGSMATTAGQAWLVDMSSKTASSGGATSTSTTTSPPTTSSTTTTTASGFSATVAPSGNEWWIQAKVTSGKTVTKVEAKVGSKAFVALDKESYGWSKSLNAPKGTTVQFRVTASDGSVATTAGQAWLVDMSAKTAGSGTSTGTTSSPPPSTTTTTASSFRATFGPKSQSNNWWIETTATGNQGIAKVEAKVNSGSYVTLDKTSHGTYAKSIHAPDGAKVTFRATSTSGATYSSVGYTWG